MNRRGVEISVAETARLFPLTTELYWVVLGTGTPKDTDEVNRREVGECDG